MLNEFNLLVSSARGNEREAGAELRYLLRELGENELALGRTPVSGLLVAKTAMDPLLVIEKLRPVLSKNPWKFRYILKIKPIMRVVPCDVGLVCETIAGLAWMVKSDETFRLTVQKRHNKLDSKQLIDEAAKRVPRKVDLRNPSKTIMVEIVADIVGVSVLETDDVLAVELEKKKGPANAGLKAEPNVPIPNV